MIPNELFLEIAEYLNQVDLKRLIFINKNIYQILCKTETIKFYQKTIGCSLESAAHSLFMFKTIYYSSCLKRIT